MRAIWYVSSNAMGYATRKQISLHTIKVTADVEELTNELRTGVYQLVLLQIDGVNAADLLRRVARLSPGVPTLILGAKDAEAVWIELIRSRSLEDLVDLAGGESATWDQSQSRLSWCQDVNFSRAVSYIHDHVCDGSLSLGQVAAQVPVSRFHFSRLFKKHVGVSFRDYVTQLRMEAAKKMLARQRLVTEVCYAVGYNDLTHFGRLFRKQNGRSPSSYRREIFNIASLPSKGESKNYPGAGPEFQPFSFSMVTDAKHHAS